MNLSAVERKWQKKWMDAKIFEANPKKKKKYFITVPYPYVSGTLHIGHGRSYSCTDTFARYKRMRGYNVLFPMAFHITGTPVLAICNRVIAGDKKYIEMLRGYVKLHTKDEKKVEEVLKSFDKPWNVYAYFSKTMKTDFLSLGVSNDWRRVFTTGDEAYNKFIEWQYSKFHEKNYLKRMRYPITYCVNDKNAVSEDDIKDGDTDPVDVQEFSAVKFELSSNEFILTATLRPETIYGLTNVWINPLTDYVKARYGSEFFIISSEAFDKMNHQGWNLIREGIVHGADLIGKKVKAPFTNKEIPILPSSMIDSDIGTGPVMSVPSHAPPDYVMLADLQGNDELLKKFHVEEAKDIQLISMITLPGYGQHPAKEVVEKGDVVDVEKLKKELYKDEHNKGVLKDNAGKYAGLPVSKAKEAVKNDLIKQGLALKFYETSRKAECRCNGKVVVAVLDDQWFLDYNSPGWKDSAFNCLNQMSIFPEKYKSEFEATFNWLDKRPCIRKRGLGTEFPYQKGWIIESLSDSTIYMAFYTIAHTINENKVKPAQLTPQLFDYVFLGKGLPASVSKSTGIKASLLNKMRSEFTYWYPMDHRHTAIMHISNHLSFMIFHHAGIFPKKHWPKTLTLIEPVIVEGQKMSKSKGNVIPLSEISSKYGADLFRIYMLNNAEFSSLVDWKRGEFNNVKKNYERFCALCDKILKAKKSVIKNSLSTALINSFNEKVSRTTEHIESFNLRKAVQVSFYEVMNLFTDYLNITSDYGALKSLLPDWLKILSPVAPHTCEEYWMKLGMEGFISTASWPVIRKFDPVKACALDLINNVANDVSEVIKLVGKTPSTVKIFTCEDWKHELYDLIKNDGSRDANALIKKAMSNPLIKNEGNSAVRIIQAVIKEPSKLVSAGRDEFKILLESKRFFEQRFNCKFEVIRAEGSTEQKARNSLPGKPGILIN